MAMTPNQRDFLIRHILSAENAVDDEDFPLDGSAPAMPSSPAPATPPTGEPAADEAAAVSGESQVSSLDPLQLLTINDRMKQVEKKKFPTALDREKAHWLGNVKGLVDSGKLDEAEKSLKRLEDLAAQVGAGALQGEQYVMKSMGEKYIKKEKNAPSNKIEIGGIERDIRPTEAGAHVTSYMTDEQTTASEVKVEGSDAKTKLTQQGKAVDGENIFVMDGEGKIMAQKAPPDTRAKDYDPKSVAMSGNKPVLPHHSNFLRGEDVAGAGELHTDNDGILKKVTDQSGHYLPDAVQTQQVLESLEEQGANLNNVKFTATKTKTEGMAKEFQQGVTVEQFKRRHALIDEMKGKIVDSDGEVVDSESMGTKMFLDAQNQANSGRTTFFRLFDFDIEYPVVLTNKYWQKKKSLKDKAKTKTGLGDLLTRAEKSWAKIDFKTLHPKMSTDTSFLSDPSALAEAKKTAVAQKGDLAAVANALTAAGYKAKQIVEGGKVSKDASAAATEIKQAAYDLEALLSKYSVEKAYDDAIKTARRRKR